MVVRADILQGNFYGAIATASMMLVDLRRRHLPHTLYFCRHRLEAVAQLGAHHLEGHLQVLHEMTAQLINQQGQAATFRQRD